MQSTITWILIWLYLATLTGIKIYNTPMGMAKLAWVFLFYVTAAIAGYLIDKVIKGIR